LKRETAVPVPKERVAGRGHRAEGRALTLPGGRLLPCALAVLALSGCGLEIWEGEILTESGKSLFRETYFSERSCRVDTAERFNAMSTEGRKKLSYSGGDWVEQDPERHRCRLKHKLGF